MVLSTWLVAVTKAWVAATPGCDAPTLSPATHSHEAPIQVKFWRTGDAKQAGSGAYRTQFQTWTCSLASLDAACAPTPVGSAARACGRGMHVVHATCTIRRGQQWPPGRESFARGRYGTGSAGGTRRHRKMDGPGSVCATRATRLDRALRGRAEVMPDVLVLSASKAQVCLAFAP